MILLRRTLGISGLVLGTTVGCRSVQRDPEADLAVWASAPLAPQLRFTEAIAAGDVVLLVVDRHSGAPLRDAQASFDSTPMTALADTLGRIHFRRVPQGPLHLRVRRVGYFMRTDSLTLPAAMGLALVVQMQRMATTLEQASQPPMPKPPNGR